MYVQLRQYGKGGAIKKLYARFCSSTSCPFNASELKSFEDMPGPRSLPVIGTLYKYIPFFGEYSLNNMFKNGLLKMKRYGPLVREELVPGEKMVWVYRPEDISEIFKSEVGLNPKRKTHLALLKYREDRKNIYNNGGILTINGMDWWKLRREFQKVISKPSNVIDYLEDTDLVVQDFVRLCLREKPDDYLPLFSRLFLELTCLVAFDEKMQSLTDEERQPNSRTSKLIDAAIMTNSATLQLDSGPRLWRFFETPLYRKLRIAQNYMEGIAMQMITRKTRDLSMHRKQSLLEQYLQNEALDIKDIVAISCDMLLAGIDTTTYTMAFGLYHLTKYKDVQEKLRAEAMSLLPDPNAPITAEALRNARYTKAVIKETFRLNPISVGVGRVLQNDVALGGYRVPQGTIVVTQNQVTCRLPEYFHDPESFIPERWLRENKLDKDKSINPYTVLPFGHGTRSCIARRFAEQNMQVFLLRICRQTRFTWDAKPLNMISSLINKPDAPLKLRFESLCT